MPDVDAKTDYFGGRTRPGFVRVCVLCVLVSSPLLGCRATTDSEAHTASPTSILDLVNAPLWSGTYEFQGSTEENSYSPRPAGFHARLLIQDDTVIGVSSPIGRSVTAAQLLNEHSTVIRGTIHGDRIMWSSRSVKTSLRTGDRYTLATTVSGTITDGVITGTFEDVIDFQNEVPPDFVDARFWGTFRLVRQNDSRNAPTQPNAQR